MDIVSESADDMSKSNKLTREIIGVQLDLEQFKTDTEKRFNQMEEKIEYLRKEIKWAIGLVCSLIIMFGIIR